jgi:hypothetical protein
MHKNELKTCFRGDNHYKETMRNLQRNAKESLNAKRVELDGWCVWRVGVGWGDR